MPYKRRVFRRDAPPRVILPKLPSPLEKQISDLTTLLNQAKLSHAYWLREASKTRLGLSDNRYGGHYAIDGAGNWRRRAAEILAELRPLQQQLRSTRR
jgi:hypothetical protein